MIFLDFIVSTDVVYNVYFQGKRAKIVETKKNKEFLESYFSKFSHLIEDKRVRQEPLIG